MRLTTQPVATLEAAVEKVQWHSQRFQIEGFHRILKSGCRIEKRQLLDVDALRQCLALDLVVVWSIADRSRWGREQPTRPCTVAFTADEWHSLHGLKNQTPPRPPTPPGLQPMIRAVAPLGGFLGRKGDGEPGAQTLGRGWPRLHDIAQIWRAVLDLDHINPTPMRAGP